MSINSAVQWKQDLASWGIPDDILNQAPTSPWIHPPAMFTVPEEIPDSPSHSKAREILVGGDSILDIGCGGGIAAFAAVSQGMHVIGVDHQSEMLTMFASNAQARGLTHEEFLGDWPDLSDVTPEAQVVTCHHVAYNVPEIAPFLEALNQHATKRVVVEIPAMHPLSSLTSAWQHFWSLDRPTNPTASDLHAIACDLGFAAHIQQWESDFGRPQPFEDQVRHLRIRLCLDESRDQEIADYLTNSPINRKRALATIWWDK